MKDKTMIRGTKVHPTRWACHADRIFDGERVLDGQALIIEEGSISALVPLREIPQNLPVVAMPGCTILPGLIDMHTHFMRWEGPSYLAYGVTTIRDVGNSLEWILARRAEAHRHPWPRIFCTGPALDYTEPFWKEIAYGCRDEADARQKVRELAAAGVDGIKLYAKLPGDWVPGIVEEAHGLDLPVMMHCGQTGLLTAAKAGVDESFHLDGLIDDIWPEHPSGWLRAWGYDGFANTRERQKAVADEIARLGIIITPTLTIWDFMGRKFMGGAPLPEDAPYIPRQLKELFVLSKPEMKFGEAWEKALAVVQRFIGLLLERQVPVLAGTDVPWNFHTPGHMLWRELALLVGCGMSTLDALRTATSLAAKTLRANKLGRLAPGCIADFVVIAGDPTQAIPSRPSVRSVVRSGQPHEPKELLAETSQYLGSFEDEPMAIAYKCQK